MVDEGVAPLESLDLELDAAVALSHPPSSQEHDADVRRAARHDDRDHSDHSDDRDDSQTISYDGGAACKEG